MFIPPGKAEYKSPRSERPPSLQIARLAKRSGRVTPLAAPPEPALVDIVGRVTGEAGRRQLERSRIGVRVTVVTAGFAMRARQWVGRRRIMIEFEERPALRAMARFAPAPEPPLVHTIGVTGGTIERCTLEARRLVAGFAWHAGMQPAQRKPRFAVIECRGGFPARLLVARLAAGPELTLVYVVLLVARNAFGLDLLCRTLAVARCALELAVRAPQREARLPVVVELRLLPLDRSVALRAVLAEPALVHIILAMATDAGRRNALVFLLGMASVAFDADMLAHERERRFRVIETDVLFPIAFVVAGLALRSKAAFMHVVLAMALDTNRRSLAKLHAG